MRYVQRMAGGAFGLTAAALIIFGTVGGTKPSGVAVPYILFGVLACAAAVWLTMLPVGRLSDRVDEVQEQRDTARTERDTLRGEREALRETSGTIRTERDQAQGALRNLQTEAQTAGKPRLPQVVRDRVIELDDLPPWVLKRTFEDCELVGPGPAWIGPSERTGCTLLGPAEDTFLTVEKMADLPPGTVRFINCRLVNCELQSIVLAGMPAHIEQFRKEFHER